MTNSEQPISFMHFERVCPFLTCLEIVPHDHPICPKCGAVKWGNTYCDECQKHWSLEDRDRKIAQADRDLELALAPFIEARERARKEIMTSFHKDILQLTEWVNHALSQVYDSGEKTGGLMSESHTQKWGEVMASFYAKRFGLQVRLDKKLDQLWQVYNKAAHPFEEAHDKAVKEAMEVK